MAGPVSLWNATRPPAVSKKGAVMGVFPVPYRKGVVPMTVLAPGPRLRLQRGERVLHRAKAVAMGIVPDGIEDHRRGHELRPGQRTAPAGGHGAAVVGQPPTCVERHAEGHRAMTGEDRLEAQLARDRVDGARMLEEPPGRYRAILDDHAGRQCLGIEMPLPVTGLRFGMGLDDQSRVRVILPRPSQHLGEAVGIRLPQPDRGVSARLVDDQHEARIGRVERRIDGAVLAQMRLPPCAR